MLAEHRVFTNKELWLQADSGGCHIRPVFSVLSDGVVDLHGSPEREVALGAPLNFRLSNGCLLSRSGTNPEAAAPRTLASRLGKRLMGLRVSKADQRSSANRQLLSAASEGDLKAVRRSVNRGADIDIKGAQVCARW
jgi:hypothetical protein